jgi:ABC-type uncharacterized transport system auxiliary subunit
MDPSWPGEHPPNRRGEARLAPTSDRTSTARSLRAVASGAVLFLAGCVNLGADAAPSVEQVHALAPVAVRAPLNSAEVLAVHAFRSRARFDARLIREDPDGRLTVYEHERWAEEPAEAATDAVREALASSKLFAGVFPSVEGAKATRSLHGFVLGFHVVAPAQGAWRAAFRVRFDLVDVNAGELLASGAYEGTAPLPGASTVGLGAAMGKAVGDALSAAVAAWSAAGTIR